jgi:hypothetical protein
MQTQRAIKNLKDQVPDAEIVSTESNLVKNVINENGKMIETGEYCAFIKFYSPTLDEKEKHDH